jgi:hypothetical protein
MDTDEAMDHAQAHIYTTITITCMENVKRRLKTTTTTA